MWPWDITTWQPISYPSTTTYFTGSNEYFPENPDLTYSATDNNNNYDNNCDSNFDNSFDNNNFASSYGFGAEQSTPTLLATNTSVPSNIPVLEPISLLFFFFLLVFGC